MQSNRGLEQCTKTRCSHIESIQVQDGPLSMSGLGIKGGASFCPHRSLASGKAFCFCDTLPFLLETKTTCAAEQAVSGTFHVLVAAMFTGCQCDTTVLGCGAARI